MSTLKAVWNCMFAPRLVKIYGSGPVEKFYEPLPMERWGDQVINSLYLIWKIGVYTSPLLVGILYHRGYLEPQGIAALSKLFTGVGVILIVSYCIRGYARANNPIYQQFIGVLEEAEKNVASVKKELIKYDFEFHAWPVEYNLMDEKEEVRKHISIHRPVLCESSFQLIYPGSIGLLQMILGQSLLQGRSRLIESYKGERYKVKTLDGNEIDTMFVDKRNSPAIHGNTLVVCSEGNAGFYEIGTIITPIEAGYSVLGWNHPGFGGSTGMPYPSQEQNAIDAVVQFAIYKLGFKIENLIFFGWSIGGYTSSWAAMNYPEAKGVVIDATFDDILPLAINHMPKWWEPIVKMAIREHVNLDVAEQLTKFPGPIMLIRRTEDEVICLRENDLSSNRGNHLLTKVLKHRYPFIFAESQVELLNEYLAHTGHAQEQLLQRHGVDESMCLSLLQSYISEYSKSYPMKIGREFNDRDKSRMALFLASKYVKDFKASHCISLPGEMFHAPWDIHVESDYVFT